MHPPHFALRPKLYLNATGRRQKHWGQISDQGGLALAERMIELMRLCNIPNGLSALNYTENDIPGLVEGAYKQQRLLVNSPRLVTHSDLEDLYRDAMRYW